MADNNITTRGGGGGAGGIDDPMFFYLKENEVKVSNDKQNVYFTDTTQVSGQKEYLEARNFLSNIPPPNANIIGKGPGADEVGNPFLKPNALVAFFMAYTELSNIARQMSNAGLNLMLTQMSMGNELAKSIKEQKKAASEAEASMYIASAVANFAEVLGAVIQVAGQVRGQGKAENDMKDQKTKYEKNTADAETKLNADTAELKRLKNDPKVYTQEKKVQVAKELKAELEKNPIENKEKIKNIDREIDTREKELNDLKKNKNKLVDAQRERVEKSENELREAKLTENKFNVNYQSHLDTKVQQRTLLSDLTSKMISRGLQGTADLAKAAFTLQKGAAEGQEALLNSYLQNVNKQEDQLRDYMKSSHDLVAQLMQALQKFSDDEKKLGSSIATQSTG